MLSMSDILESLVLLPPAKTQKNPGKLLTTTQSKYKQYKLPAQVFANISI